jgi:hypothetical protein
MITIDEYEASWRRQSEAGTFEYRHHTRTGQVSLGDALTEVAQMFDPNVNVTVESIDGYKDYKIVITSSFGVLHKGLNTPVDDGIKPRDIHNPYGFAIVFSYTGDKSVHGIDGASGFEMFATTIWRYLQCNPELRSKEVQKMIDDHESELALTV